MNSNVISGLICSIGMFLFGIETMGDAVKSLDSGKLKEIIRRMTKNKFTAVLSGSAVTGLIQSSCAVSVMTTQLVACGAMTTEQSVGVIMGANIGTTVTSLLIAVNFSAFAPPAVLAGVMMKMFSKSRQVQSLGLAISGFGLLFAAMSLMSEYMSFFKESAAAVMLLENGRIKSFLLGLVITAVMQSSSATVGLLQSAAKSGLIPMKNALYILYGQNIGAVFPTLLANVKSEPAAKRTALIHLFFNIFGTGIFIFITELFPYARLLGEIEDGYFRISLAHIIFNAVSTAALLPFSKSLIKAAERTERFFAAGSEKRRAGRG